jgi:two-component system cell cycle sensor histidine kinase/response regulator CckA
LNAVIAAVRQMIRRLIGEDNQLDTIPARELGRVKADPGQIGQVLMNLVINARDAMPRGGKLTIETANGTLPPVSGSSGPTLIQGPCVVLTVRDSGSGIDEATRARIFEPFFTTKEAGKGTGLGLSTVYGIIKQSGGQIEVESEVGRGTTFHIYLPRVEEEASMIEKSRSGPSLPVGWETILVVEDNEAVRCTAVRALRLAGFNVVEAESGTDALRLCGNRDLEIHLMVTDVVMPQMSGPELVARATAVRPDLKVLYVSGFTDQPIVHEDVLKGAAFLQKPFSPDALAWRVREVLDARADRAA